LLREAGLTASEAKVFIASCRLGPSNVSTIAAEAGVHRAAAYNTLNQLAAKGLVSWAIVGGKRVYQAASPTELTARIEERLEAMRGVLARLSVELQKTAAEAARPKVSAFFGLEGVKSILAEELEAAGDKGVIRAMHALPELAELTPVFVSWWHRKRARRRIVFKAIFDKSEASSKRIRELSELPLTEAKQVDYTQVAPVTYHVAGDKLSIISAAKTCLFGVVVESREVATAFAENFDRIWKKMP